MFKSWLRSSSRGLDIQVQPKFFCGINAVLAYTRLGEIYNLWKFFSRLGAASFVFSTSVFSCFDFLRFFLRRVQTFAIFSFHQIWSRFIIFRNFFSRLRPLVSIFPLGCVFRFFFGFFDVGLNLKFPFFRFQKIFSCVSSSRQRLSPLLSCSRKPMAYHFPTSFILYVGSSFVLHVLSDAARIFSVVTV